MSRTPNSSEAGFTLAGLVVMLTVVAIFIAYTVPKQWSIAVARDRDQQALFAMKQYARAIREFQKVTNVVPTSLEQLKQKQNNRRFMRGKGELIDPLTGEVDWIVIPAQPAQQQQAAQQQVDVGPIVGVGGTRRTGVQPPPQTSVPVNPQQAGQPGNFVGPLGGVRPNKTGQSYLTLNGAETYEQWSYTTIDLNNEITAHQNAMMVK